MLELECVREAREVRRAGSGDCTWLCAWLAATGGSWLNPKTMFACGEVGGVGTANVAGKVAAGGMRGATAMGCAGAAW